MLETIIGIRAAALLRKAALPIGIVLAFGALLLLAYCHGNRVGRSGEVIQQHKREIETQRKIGNAESQAADQRLSDATNLQQQKQELHDAIENGADPDAVRVLRGCIILRQQGRDTSDLPQCR